MLYEQGLRIYNQPKHQLPSWLNKRNRRRTTQNNTSMIFLYTTYFSHGVDSMSENSLDTNLRPSFPGEEQALFADLVCARLLEKSESRKSQLENYYLGYRELMGDLPSPTRSDDTRSSEDRNDLGPQIRTFATKCNTPPTNIEIPTTQHHSKRTPPVRASPRTTTITRDSQFPSRRPVKASVRMAVQKGTSKVTAANAKRQNRQNHHPMLTRSKSRLNKSQLHSALTRS